MKLFAEQDKSSIHYVNNVDTQNAIDGFSYLGYDIVTITQADLHVNDYKHRIHNNIFVGGIDFMTKVFKDVGKTPSPIDFPEEIINAGLLNRTINKTTIQNIFDNKTIPLIPFFVKPVKTKLFDGALLSKFEDLNYLRFIDFSEEVWVCNKIDIISEHRAYIHKGEIVYCCNYSGNFKVNPDYDYITKLIKSYKSAPIAYTIDVAVLMDGSMTVIEFNDFWAIGGYGIPPWTYASMIEDRYNEIINT